MTPDITDQDEREAIAMAQHQLAVNEYARLDYVAMEMRLFRALLARATRAHD